MKNLNIIVAMSADRAIGRAGDLIWHLRQDLRHFKELTMGHPIVMGRRTWQSLPKGALPGRRNIVVSRNPDFSAPGAEVFSTLAEAIEAAGEGAFIIGGGQIYAAALPLASALHLTEIDASFPDADTHFPPVSPADWTEDECGDWETDEKSGLRYRFRTLRR